MNDPACLLLMLEQRSLSLEDHTRLFVEIANFTHYPDYCLCTFYKNSLNNECRARLSRDGPRGNFAVFVEWVLVSCGSPLTMDFADDDTSPTSDPEPSPPSPRAAERQPEPSATDEPSPSGATVLRIAPEPEPITSDQVREPATSHATVNVTVEREGAEESPAHCTAAEGEQSQDSENLMDWDTYADMPVLLPPSSELSSYPELPTYLDFPPTHPPSPAASYHPCHFSSATAASWQPLYSPSVHHLCGGIAAGLPVSIGVMAG